MYEPVGRLEVWEKHRSIEGMAKVGLLKVWMSRSIECMRVGRPIATQLKNQFTSRKIQISFHFSKNLQFSHKIIQIQIASYF